MAINVDDVRTLEINAGVVTESRERLGSIRRIFVDSVTGEPSWVLVRSGPWGLLDTFVPLVGGRVQGRDIVVPYEKEIVRNAPGLDADSELSAVEEEKLYRHYRLGENTAMEER